MQKSFNKSCVLVIVILISIHSIASGQFKLVTENLTITSISGKAKTDEFDVYKGPYFRFDCKLIYKGQDTLIDVNNKFYDFHITYRFQGRSYKVKPVSWDEACSQMKLSNNDSITLSFSDNIFYWNHNLYKGDGDYSSELMEILPTLSVCLSFYDSLEVCSCEIINVKIELLY